MSERAQALEQALRELTEPMCERWSDNGIVRQRMLVVAGDDAFDRYKRAVALLAREAPAEVEPTPDPYILADVTASATGWTPASHLIRDARAERDTALQENARMDAAAEDLTKDFWLLQGEVQTLREALASIANSACCGCCQEAALIARAALAPRPPEPQ